MRGYLDLVEKFPTVPFVFCPTEDRYYFPDPDGYFTHKTRVRKEALFAYLIEHGWDFGTAKTTLKACTHTNVYGFDMRPYNPPIFQNENQKFINTWRATKLIPEPGEWPSVNRVLESLLLNNVPDPQDENHTLVAVDQAGKEWLINWLAWAVQHPASVPGTAVLVNGAQNSGKNTLYHIMREILGEGNCAKVEQHQLESRFNSSWADKAFIFGDEIFNKEAADITDKLKSMITSAQVRIEAKGVNDGEVKNHAKLYFASNHLDPLKLDADDRRFSVFTRHEPVSDEFKAFSRSLFTVENEFVPSFYREVQAFAHYLLSLAVDEKRVKTPFNNISRRVLIKNNDSAHSLFFKHVDEHGIDELIEETAKAARHYEGPEAINDTFGTDWDFDDRGVATTAIYKCYAHFAKTNGFRYTLPLNKFGGAAMGHTPPWPPTRPALSSGKQVRCYKVRRTSDVQPEAPEVK